MTSKSPKWFVLALMFLVVGLTLPALAHHGTSVSYDQDAWITVTGTVTQFVWRNPHSALFLDITDEDGKVTNFAIELNSPGVMVRNGWTRDLFKAGDQVEFRVHPSKVGAPVGECLGECEVIINGQVPQRNSNP